MACYVIADLHLSAARPQLLQAFAAFVRSLHPEDILIVAGDLFDFYAGPDAKDTAQQQVQDIVRQAASRGIPCHFVPGNRDFLLRPELARTLGFASSQEHYVLPWPGCPDRHILITHGDVLCSNDTGYQRFRKICRCTLLQRLFLLLPEDRRRSIGRSIREKSRQQASFRRTDEHYGVVADTVHRLMQAQHCQLLIHGHIHYFASYKDSTGQEERLSLGAWDKCYSYVRIDDTGVQAVQKPLSDLLS